jgi:lipopolysaccharide transport system ATP-binding protein
MEMEIGRVVPGLCVGYALFDEAGEVLYWSYQTDVPEPEWPQLKPGRCVLRSKFPGRMLNEGVYRLDLIGGLHWREWFFEPGLTSPSIYITIQGGLSDSPHWNFRRPGRLAPVLPWQIVS